MIHLTQTEKLAPASFLWAPVTLWEMEALETSPSLVLSDGAHLVYHDTSHALHSLALREYVQQYSVLPDRTSGLRGRCAISGLRLDQCVS